MQFCVAGVSYKTAPVEIRERLSFEDATLTEAYRLLLEKQEISECVILSTCNRVEIFAMVNGDRERILIDFMRDFHKFSGSLDAICYCKTGSDAAEHLCLVASGLDSMVLGETQVFAQIKEAYQKSMAHKGVGYVFEHLFPLVFSIVKKIRTKTAIGEKNISVSYTAVQLAHSIFQNFQEKKVMILGAGETGKLTLRNLISAGIRKVIVANRTFQKAVEIAERFSGIPVMIHEIEEYLADIDIIISSISASHYIIGESQAEKFNLKADGRNVFLVDISVPRSIDPMLGHFQNIHLYNIDDLKAVVDANIELRKAEALKCHQLIRLRLPELVKYLNACDILPTLVSIRSKAEEIRKVNMERMVQKLSISTDDRIILDTVTKSIVNKILKHSENLIREFASSLKS